MEDGVRWRDTELGQLSKVASILVSSLCNVGHSLALEILELVDENFDETLADVGHVRTECSY